MPKLIAWLDREIEHPDIPYGESAEFMGRVLNGLMAKYEIDTVDALVLDRFRLRDQIRQRIQQHRDEERKKAFQGLLLPDSPLIVDDTVVFDFLKEPYAPSWYCESAYVFKKHYFGSKPGELAEKTPSGNLTEDFLCAQYLDNLDEVEFGHGIWRESPALSACKPRPIGSIRISSVNSRMAALPPLNTRAETGSVTRIHKTNLPSAPSGNPEATADASS